MSLLNIAIALDQLGNALLGGWHKTAAVINWIFQTPDHCLNAYLSELRGSQNHPEYRK